METKSNCREIEGITIGLIDSIISICRVLKDRDFKSFDVKEALKDLKNDEDLKKILNMDS